MTVLTRKRKIILAEVVLIIAVFLLARAYSQRHLVDGIAPSFNATTLAGKTVSLESFKGKPLLLHFWASWCPVCSLEEKSINAISQDYDVVSIAMQSGDADAVTAHMKEKQLHFPTVVDEHGELAQRFGVRGVPTSFIVSPDGNIAYTEVGYTTEIGLRIRLWLTGD